MGKAAEDDKNKLMAIISAFAKKEQWKRKQQAYRNTLVYLFNYGKEELILSLQGSTLHLQLKPQDATRALNKIANVLRQFFLQNPTSAMKLSVTLLNLNEHRVKDALRSMLEIGIDIDKVTTMRNKSGTIFPSDQLQQLIKEVKSKTKPKPRASV